MCKHEISVPGKPQGKGRARVSTYGGFARAYTPERTAAYENLIKVCYSESGAGILENALKMTVTAFYGVPSSFSRKKRQSALNGEIRPTTKPDLDNVVKVVCDALNGLAYTDDKNIVELRAYKYYAESPRVEIVIEEVKSNGT